MVFKLHVLMHLLLWTWREEGDRDTDAEESSGNNPGSKLPSLCFEESGSSIKVRATKKSLL